jgi:superfamily II DNA or RNA helicase
MCVVWLCVLCVCSYTPAQVEALRSGMNQGLTMIVGPPGTGKTDVAVQIICNLYHNYPTQKILLVAHSNTALNDLFEKIMQVRQLTSLASRIIFITCMYINIHACMSLAWTGF